jgi:hypothetical protein
VFARLHCIVTTVRTAEGLVLQIRVRGFVDSNRDPKTDNSD